MRMRKKAVWGVGEECEERLLNPRAATYCCSGIKTVQKGREGGVAM